MILLNERFDIGTARGQQYWPEAEGLYKLTLHEMPTQNIS